eukprot:CAMPEP_0176029690 /NCGR_PEP_ID=MMETSP0120_2-20121206/14592_1 /TAXON_ID=160619 /ORGANISM="Kryptoperidinium foliaceum, Strain CCMP 1326" /LENGTH=214 /DNA_ID=CAMNT_0017362917 /DNA_START=159 /DNA_END=800 /DNA_ORIENTATION=-
MANGDGDDENRTVEAAKQLLCGGIAGSVAKTVTAPFSRLTILFQVHSLVTTKSNRPKYAMNLKGGFSKIIERGGFMSLWKGNMTSVIHRFPYSAINFYVYENALDMLVGMQRSHREQNETYGHLKRRISHRMTDEEIEEERRMQERARSDDNMPRHKFMAGAIAGCSAVFACYPLDLVRTRLTTELDEHYRGIRDAFRKIYKAEGIRGFYSGIG